MVDIFDQSECLAQITSCVCFPSHLSSYCINDVCVCVCIGYHVFVRPNMHVYVCLCTDMHLRMHVHECMHVRMQWWWFPMEEKCIHNSPGWPAAAAQSFSMNPWFLALLTAKGPRSHTIGPLVNQQGLSWNPSSSWSLPRPHTYSPVPVQPSVMDHHGSTLFIGNLRLSTYYAQHTNHQGNRKCTSWPAQCCWICFNFNC